MIAKTISTLSGKVRINIPTELTEITLGQMILMESATGNEIPLIPELTEEVTNNITDINDLIDIRERVLSLAHKIKYQYQETKLPEKLMGVKVPRNLSIEPAGAYLVSRDLIATEINKHIEQFGEDNWQRNFRPSLECCAGVLANYFYSRVTGELWSEPKAEEFKEKVLQLSLAEALPVARFFLTNYPNISRQKIGLWQAFKLQLRKRRISKGLKNING